MLCLIKDQFATSLHHSLLSHCICMQCRNDNTKMRSHYALNMRNHLSFKKITGGINMRKLLHFEKT